MAVTLDRFGRPGYWEICLAFTQQKHVKESGLAGFVLLWAMTWAAPRLRHQMKKAYLEGWISTVEKVNS